ncbi:MAG TPA: nucleotidyltransferase family protein, partial [Candidatus Methylomirabilis sp.]|nr:nucleotidyltransferase family protein [Candidatus Methylomirabilis sp.]
VELHWALSRPGGGFRLDERAVLARAVARPSAAGPAGRVPSAEDMVLHLASQNEEDAFGRLRRLVDIDRVVALAPRLDWSYLRESAGKARAQTLLALSLRLAQRLLDTPVPRGFVESLRLSRLCRLNLALLRPVSWLMTPDGQRPAVAAELLLLWTTVGWRSRLQRCLVFAWPHSDALAAAWRTEIDEVVERRARGPRRLWVLAKLVAYQLWVYGRGLVAVFTSSGRRSLRFWSGRSTAGAMAARVLAAILPSPEETWLLRACLLPDTWAREAWAAYEREAGDLVQVFRHDRRGLKMLGPLLNGAAHRSAFDASPGVLTVLRTAALREDLRSREYRRIVGEVLSALGAAEVPAVVVGGAALGELVYAGPALRHSHDAEFLLREVDVPRALSALAAGGLGRPAVAGHACTIAEHPSGLPLVLRRDLLPERFYSSFTEEAWAASERQTIAGVPARALSRIDNLLHVCGRAFCSPERDSLLWICDAWLLTAQEPGLDWDRMIERATASRLVLPVGVVLDYLARELDAPVPAPVLARLRAAVDAISPIARDVALFGVRVGGRSSLAELLRAAGGPRDRLRLLGCLLFPSPAYMRHAYGLESAAWLPLSYVRRTLGYVAARLRSRLPRDPGRQRGLEESSPDRAL